MIRNKNPLFLRWKLGANLKIGQTSAHLMGLMNFFSFNLWKIFVVLVYSKLNTMKVLKDYSRKTQNNFQRLQLSLPSLSGSSCKGHFEKRYYVEFVFFIYFFPVLKNYQAGFWLERGGFGGDVKGFFLLKFFHFDPFFHIYLHLYFFVFSFTFLCFFPFSFLVHFCFCFFFILVTLLNWLFHYIFIKMIEWMNKKMKQINQ